MIINNYINFINEKSNITYYKINYHKWYNNMKNITHTNYDKIRKSINYIDFYIYNIFDITCIKGEYLQQTFIITQNKEKTFDVKITNMNNELIKKTEDFYTCNNIDSINKLLTDKLIEDYI